ncbi:MAG: arginine deiminase family protein, partial [Gemmobacter sp.]
LALICPDALPDDFAGWLRDRQIRTIPVGYRAAMADMACNVLALGDGRVLSPRHSHATNAALRAEGLTVLDPELRLFAHGGGSAHCLTMPLRRLG